MVKSKLSFSERSYARVIVGEPVDGENMLAWQSHIKEAYDEYISLPRKPTFQDALKLALVVQEGVSNDLSFCSLLRSPNEKLSPNYIQKYRATNCYGNTIITSEILEAMGVDHYVAFVNQHSFVWLYDIDSGESFLLDLRRSLRQPTTGLVNGRPPLEWQLGQGPLVADLALDTIGLVKRASDRGVRNQAESSPWLGLNPMSTKYFRNKEYSLDTALWLPMRVYPSLPGREVLEIYHNSIVDSKLDNTLDVAEAYQSMEGTYPDIDPQNQLKLAKRAVGAMLAKGLFGEARLTAEAVANSMLPDDHTANSFFLPDTLRKIGRRTHNAGYIRTALKDYHRFLKDGYGGELVLGKIRVAEQEIADIEPV